MKRLLPFFLVLSSVGIGVLHFVTPGHDMFLHDTWRRLSYFPIAVGALFYGLRGGVLMALINSIAFIPHLLLYMGRNPVTYRSELTEVLLYFAAGILVGIISGKERRVSEKYRTVSRQLEESLTRVKDDARTLLSLEDQLRVSQKRSVAGELSSSLAHEIKNPLGAIRGAAEIILDEAPEGGLSRKFAGILIKETERLDKTLAGMLSMGISREEGDEGVETSLAEVVGHVNDTMSIRLKDRQVRLAMACEESAEQVRVDGEKVSQVLVNLVLNAVEAVGKGGRIDVRATLADGFCALTVADDGPGIEPDFFPKLFEPFVTGRDDGTGLGLPISRRIAESLGGTLVARNRDEGGAEFCFKFPCLSL
ncbi:sensor histidine kinase [Desulfoluna spongiiphila]|uniref:sensor histidine kinase n=1 Tax=Desulfoluna spongiiphila TaxID=419481 RepID=UPI00125C025A|nr:HAMP domain-containing sensor histidine kinase [Desulfoluna spongiiphila]VVS93475.1 histidine kinase domain [Desulfoluna spongiiphila]